MFSLTHMQTVLTLNFNRSLDGISEELKYLHMRLEKRQLSPVLPCDSKSGVITKTYFGNVLGEQGIPALYVSHLQIKYRKSIPHSHTMDTKAWKY
jgi:hypothetical protein